MLSWLGLILSTCLAVEIGYRLPFAKTVPVLANTGRKATQLIQNRKISDHWKERVLPVYAFQLFIASLLLLFSLILLISPILLIAALLLHFGFHVMGLFMTAHGVGVSLLIASLYWIVRGRFLNV